MFSEEEAPLIHGDDAAVEDFVDCTRCLVVDWRGSEEEVLEDIQAFVPAGDLHFEITFPDSDHVGISMNFRGRKAELLLPLQPQNQFRALLQLGKQLLPDYDLKWFRCTDAGDTAAFLVRRVEWWSLYRDRHPERYQKIFRDLVDLDEVWELDFLEKESGGSTGPQRSWWKLW